MPNVWLPVLTYFAIVILVFTIVGICFHALRRMGMRKGEELESIGREIKAELENQLITIVPHIYRRLTGVSTGVELYTDGLWFWQTRGTILLIVALSTEKDISTVAPMCKSCLEKFLSKPGNQKYRVRICFPPITKTQAG